MHCVIPLILVMIYKHYSIFGTQRTMYVIQFPPCKLGIVVLTYFVL